MVVYKRVRSCTYTQNRCSHSGAHGQTRRQLKTQKRITIMSALKHGDLLAALVELPPMKVENFSVTLGVPKRIIDEARENHRGNVYRVKSDSVSWWLANAEIISWDAVARALESPGVDERNLARKIRSKYGGVGGN